MLIALVIIHWIGEKKKKKNKHLTGEDVLKIVCLWALKHPTADSTSTELLNS